MIRIYNKDGVVLNTKDKYCTENIEIAIDDTNLRPEYIVKDQTILGVTGKAEAGGIIPSGRIDITENTGSGFLDITEYSLAKVNVPIPEGFIIPTGTLNISKNGTHDVTEYSKVSVGVSPTGRIEITENGLYNVGQYLTANVQVEGAGGITPEGTIELKTNGDHDVTNYATAKVNVPIPEDYIKPVGTKSVTENGTYDVTYYKSVTVKTPVPEGTADLTSNGRYYVPYYEYVNVQVPETIPEGYILPSGNFEITANGDYNIRDKETVSVNVAGGGGGEDLWADYMNARITDGSLIYLFCSNPITSFDKYLNGFDLSSIRYFQYMFQDCSKMTSAPMFNTSSAINTSYMFAGCDNLVNVPLYNTSTAVYMNRMFEDCVKLTNVPLFDTSSATDLTYMFSGCLQLPTVPLFNTSNTTNLSYMFYCCNKLTSVPTFDTSNATKVSHMFDRCTTLESAPLLNLSKATEVTGIFSYCYALKKIEMNSWEKVTSASYAGGIAEYCYGLKDFIIRNATKAPILYNSGKSYGSPFRDCYHFDGTYHSLYNVYGAKDGRIYVPDELVDTFKAATHWSYYADLIYPISEYIEGEEPTEPYLLKLEPSSHVGSGNVLNKITEPYGEYWYESKYGGNTYMVNKFTFQIPETATKRKLKITYRIDSSYEYSHSVKSMFLDQDTNYPPATESDCHYYSNGVTAMTHEIVYENLPDGEHFIVVGSQSNNSTYAKLEFIEQEEQT